MLAQPTRRDLQFLERLKFENAMAGTLTMKQVHEGLWLDPIRCSQNFRHFMNRLNHKTYGVRSGRRKKRLAVLPVQENSVSQRLHVHFIMSRPTWISYGDFIGLADECWKKTPYGYNSNSYSDNADAGWLIYILKSPTKHCLADSIDWENFYHPEMQLLN